MNGVYWLIITIYCIVVRSGKLIWSCAGWPTPYVKIKFKIYLAVFITKAKTWICTTRPIMQKYSKSEALISLFMYYNRLLIPFGSYRCLYNVTSFTEHHKCITQLHGYRGCVLGKNVCFVRDLKLLYSA